MADPDFRRVYEQEAQIKTLWFLLADARHAAGVTQAEVAQRLGVSQSEVARIEKRGYESYTLNTLRKYVHALGEGFEVEVRLNRPATLTPSVGTAGRPSTYPSPRTANVRFPSSIA